MWIVSISCLTVTAILTVVIGHWLYSWSNPKCNGKLPPGTMGLPIIGETLEFVVPSGIYDLSRFITKKMARYGPIFRTSLFGKKTVVCTDPDINHYILQQEGSSVLLWYTEALDKLFGKQGILAQHGAIHKYLKNVILRLIGQENLKANVLSELDVVIRGHLQSWARHATVELKQATADMLFDYAATKLISYDESKTHMKFRENFNAFLYGLFSFPLDIPGTKYHKCVKGRKNSIRIIKDVFKERKESKISHGDFLDYLLEEMEREDSLLTETSAVDMIMLLLFAVQEATSTSVTLAPKFISENPNVLAELVKEHEAILKGRENADQLEITWQEYKSMTFTHMVITELVRLANFSPALCRKVINDVQVNGYTIPAGWLFMAIPSVVHLDPDVYPDPLTFNPWRWKGKQLQTGSKTFLGFGFGVRYCVGADFARLQMAVFIHHLVTKYRWKLIEGHEDIIRMAGLVFPKGLTIEISEKEKQ